MNKQQQKNNTEKKTIHKDDSGKKWRHQHIALPFPAVQAAACR